MIHPIGTTKNGSAVSVDLVSSHAGPQIAQQPHLAQLAQNLLSASDVKGDHVWLEGDMGQPIGICDVIETTQADTIFYAQRLRSDVFVRYVKNRKLELTPFLSLELRRIDKNTYELLQVIFGHPLPPLPGEEGHTAKDREYWDNHAFLWGDWPVNSRTTTKTCPW